MAGIFGPLGAVESCADDRIDRGIDFFYHGYSQVVGLA